MVKSSGLRDMEGMLSSVSDPAIEDYLQEAFTCYGTGAYRACIVLTFIATFEDLRSKVRAHSSLSREARDISKDIDLLANSQKPFENTMVERLQSSKLISALQGQKLKQIIDHRNKAAHPSGHHASAEEARFVYTECISLFLSQPVVNPGLLADELIERMKDGNFFPASSVEKNMPVFTDEMNRIDEKLYSKVFSRLAELVKSENEQERINSRYFIAIAAGLKKQKIRDAIRGSIIEKKTTDKAYGQTICEIISADGNSIDSISEGCLRRVIALILLDAKSIKVEPPQTRLRHPVRVLNGIITSEQKESFLKNGSEYIDYVIDTYLLQPILIRIIKKDDILKEKLLSKIIRRAESDDFEDANIFSISLPDIDSDFAKTFNEESSFKVICGVLHAAEIGAFRAKDVRASSFRDCPEIKNKSAIFINNSELEAKIILNNMKVNLEYDKVKLLLNS